MRGKDRVISGPTKHLSKTECWSKVASYCSLNFAVMFLKNKNTHVTTIWFYTSVRRKLLYSSCLFCQQIYSGNTNKSLDCEK